MSLFTLIQAARLGSELYKRLKKTPPEKRRAAMMEFDKAMKQAKDPTKDSTKELEEWFAKHL